MTLKASPLERGLFYLRIYCPRNYFFWRGYNSLSLNFTITILYECIRRIHIFKAWAPWTHMRPSKIRIWRPVLISGTLRNQQPHYVGVSFAWSPNQWIPLLLVLHIMFRLLVQATFRLIIVTLLTCFESIHNHTTNQTIVYSSLPSIAIHLHPCRTLRPQDYHPIYHYPSKLFYFIKQLIFSKLFLYMNERKIINQLSF